MKELKFLRNALGMIQLGALSMIGLLIVKTPATGQTPGSGVGPMRTQTFQLQAGWNAVYLEIEPLKGDPSALFAGTPIEIAAAYLRPVTAMEFIENPTAVLPDRKGWSVWYAPQREDALLSNLFAIQAHQAFLLFSKEAFTWTLQGTPLFGSARWHPNAFSLVGFPIDAAEQPTLASYFAGAAAHAPLKIYQLNGGNWTLVGKPAETVMKPGAAYWVFSKGASKFAGPLAVDFGNSAAGGVVFNQEVSKRRIEVRNVATFPQNLTLTLQPGTTGLLPLSYRLRVLDGPNQPIEAVSVAFPTSLGMGPIEPGKAFVLELEVAQQSVNAPLMSTTLTISSSAGQRIEVPLISIREDLK